MTYPAPKKYAVGVEYADTEKGRCRSCGFLCKHARDGIGHPTPRFYELERQERGKPDMYFTAWREGNRGLTTDLICFVGKVDLMAKVRAIQVKTPDQTEQNRQLVELVAKDRHCPAWYPYTPGFSPREHYDQLKMQEIETERKEFELGLAQMSVLAQERSAAIAQENKELIAGLKEIAEKNDRFSRRVTTWIVVLAVLQVISALVALPSVSWVQRFWRYLFG